MGSIIDFLREESINTLFGGRTFLRCWDTWKTSINDLIGNDPEAIDIINIGDHLSEIFQGTRSAGRSQSSLSGGGAAWESLVCWYLNLCLVGSRTVVIKQNRRLVPEPIRDAITVRYGTYPSNTESDLLAITFPRKPVYTDAKENIEIRRRNNGDIPTSIRGRFNYLEIANRLAEMHFGEYEIGIIQCKTNWNDNAQIPMLWDMVYASRGFTDRNINVGTSAFSIGNVRKFSYSFVTVPTSRGPFNPNSLRVKRVANISGGNYWGRATMSSVANSLKEIFARNFSNGANLNLRTDLNHAVHGLRTRFPYFRL